MASCPFHLRVLALADGEEDASTRGHLEACPECRQLFTATRSAQPGKPELPVFRELDQACWDLPVEPAQPGTKKFSALGPLRRATEPARDDEILRFTPEGVSLIREWGRRSETLLERHQVTVVEFRTRTVHDPYHQETSDVSFEGALVLFGPQGWVLRVDLPGFSGYGGHGKVKSASRQLCSEVASLWGLKLKRQEALYWTDLR